MLFVLVGECVGQQEASEGCAGRQPCMRHSRISHPSPSQTLVFLPPVPPCTGGSEDTFRKITEPQLLSVLRQVLAEASDSPAFIVSLVASPAGASGAPARRRRALQDGQQLLQAVAVVGGSQPLQMYRTMQSALR